MDQWAKLPAQCAKRAAERTAGLVHEELKLGLSSLATVASTAPLVGLLGTVIGIVNAFQPIGTEKTTAMANVAGRLSDACVPTEMGLLVGLASLYGYKYLSGRLDAIDREMTNAMLKLTNHLSGQHGRLAR